MGEERNELNIDIEEARRQNVQANIRQHKLEAPYYEVLSPFFFNIFEQRKIQQRMEPLISSMPKGCLILDLGSGTGNVAKYLKNSGHKIIAADVSADMLSFNPIDDRTVCDGHSLPFRDGAFNTIITYAFFHHCAQPDQVLEEICRVAAPTCLIYFGGESFLGTSKEGRVAQWLVSHYPTRLVVHFPRAWWLLSHPKGLVGWIIWLFSKPKRVIDLLRCLLFNYYQMYKENKKHPNSETKPNIFLNRRHFEDVLKQSGFSIRAGGMNELEARRSLNSKS
jgi:ubiquinone/menaquinone biosynthesis C-methylase UbiE